MKIRIIIIGIICAAIIGIIIYSRSGGAENAVSYQTDVAEKGTLVVSVSGSGTVTAANNSPVLTNATGVVTKVYVKEGDTVKSGQKIASIELDQTGTQKYLSALSSYQSAKNNLASAQANSYSSNSQMWAAHEKLMSDAVARSLAAEDPTMIQQSSDWNAAETKYKTSLDAVTQARTALGSASLSLQQSSATIYAPLSGTIAGLTIAKGTVIAATAGTTSSDSSTSKKIASVITTAAPSVAVSLSEIDVPKVKVGDKATVTLTSTGDKTYVGHVSAIDISGLVSSGVTTYPTYIEFESTLDGILPNMAASASIITDSKDSVVMVPNIAVTTAEGSSVVRILSNGTEVSVSVEIGLQSDTTTEIISGISEGTTVITGSVAATSAKSGATQSAFSLGGGRGGVLGTSTVRMITK